MKLYISTIGLILILLMSSCSSMEDTFQLQKSVFIKDVENPGLPIYSEWGYNTFGAYVDRQVFVSGDSDLPTKIVVNSDTLNLLLKGSLNGRFASIKFSFIGYPLGDYPDLKTLNDSIINLKGNKCIVTLTRDQSSEVLTIIEGKFHFKRVQDLYVDKQYTKAIISGVFSFKTFFGNEPVAISNGRFDLGIGYENFYNY
ncbi:MAG: hypothetical protein GZ091_16740 [Paludibacter sp.]|nr:hypothetical protein [Paludibacter sp.]